MNKTRIDPMPLLFPHPIVMIGVDVRGKPDFVTVAWITIACGTPPWVAIALNHVRYSMEGVKDNMVFSVNIPDRAMVKETDYCGIVTGARHNKAEDCHFKVFYGEIAGAPYIEQCPVNIGCLVKHIFRLGSHFLIAGSIEEILISDDCIKEGKPDPEKIDPIAYMTYPSLSYHGIGEFLGHAFRIGKEIQDVEDDWERQLAQ